MPYLGQRPSKGDENNFKILDDISSYTLTFDGSDSSVVSAANDTITSLTHRFVQGQRVTYTDGDGSAIAGLTDATVYFIIKEDHNTIKLATSASNAANGTAVNITNVGSGSSHTLNVAFDGVNTKFKATHTNGQKAKITRSAQLVISINGVIQQPHDTASPTTGFGFDLDGTIVFSQAPVSSDIFWAHVLTNNNVTFDISDNDIDNFTGDGSTVAFNLSKTPPDNRNILVTVDGIVQYPNDPDGTVRSYNVVENVLTFAIAPPLDVQIQVRHIGFAGSTSGGGGGVTNFYGRTGSVVLKNTDNITVNDAAITGDATVTGNLTVNGTTTTLDTNLIDVDKIEVLTGSTNVAVAVTHTGSGDLVQLYGAGTQRVTIDDEGNVGIGTDSPDAQLHVMGGIKVDASNYARVLYARDDTNLWSVGLRANDDFWFFRESGAGNVIFQHGQVGIITTTPTAQLSIGNTTGNYLNTTGIQINRPHLLGLQNGVHVYTDKSYNASATYQTAAFKATAVGGIAVGVSTDADSDGLGGTLNARIDFDGDSYFAGNMGIGTAAPGYKLELHALGGSTNLKIGSRMTDSDYGIAFGYFDEAGGKHGFGIDRKHGGTTTSNGFVFRADTGRVGIGTDSPGQRLHITDSDAGQNTLRIDSSTTAISFNNHSEFMGFMGNDSGILFINAGGTERTLSLRTVGVERLRIDSDGRVGINTTYTGIGTGTTKLAIQSTAASGSGTATAVRIGNNMNALTHYPANLEIRTTGVENYNAIRTDAGDGNGGLTCGVESYNGFLDLTTGGTKVINVKLRSSGISYFNGGKVGIGTNIPYATLLTVGHPDGVAAGSVFTSAPLNVFAAGNLGGTAGDAHKIAIFGGRATGNASGLSIYHYRRENGTSWTTDGFSFRQEVDNTSDIYDYLNFSQNRIGFGEAQPSRKFSYAYTEGANFSSTNAAYEFLLWNKANISSYPTCGASIQLRAGNTSAGGGNITGVRRGGANQGDLAFSTTDVNGNPVEQLRITSAGETQIHGDANPCLSVDRGSANNTNINLLYNGTHRGQVSVVSAAFELSAVGSTTPIKFYTNGNSYWQINEDGVVYATGASAAKAGSVHIDYGASNNSDTDAAVYVTSTTNSDWSFKANKYAGTATDYCYYARVGNSADYAFGAKDAQNDAWRFRVNGAGSIFATNTTIQSISDRRLKENIVDANSQWNDIKALKWRNFTWKNDTDTAPKLGLIADEVESISPNLIEIDAQDKEDKENGVPDPKYKTVKYSIVWMKAMKALQEAQERIETLEAKVAALEGS